jgi:hypothetical protein
VFGDPANRTRSPRGRIAVVWALIVTYATAVSAYVIPSSTVRRTLTPVARHLVVPFFSQRWNLFAPVPPSANAATFMLVRYRMRGVVETSRLVDLSSAVRRVAVSSRWLPPRMVAPLTSFNVAFEKQAYSDAKEAIRRGLDLSAPVPPWFAGDIARHRVRDIAAYGRLLSSAAPAAVPAGATIIAVRGLVVRTDVRSFAERHRPPVEARPQLVDPDAPPRLLQPGVVADIAKHGSSVVLEFDSGWLRFDADATPLGIALR